MAELAAKLRQLTFENEALRREKDELKSKNDQLKRSLDQTTRFLKEQTKKTTEANRRADNAERQLLAARAGDVQPESKDGDTVQGLQRKLSQTNKRLSDVRKRLSNMQERLANIEQVTIVTQKRELDEDDYYNSLIMDSAYENLFLDPSQLASRGGRLLLFTNQP